MQNDRDSEKERERAYACVYVTKEIKKACWTYIEFKAKIYMYTYRKCQQHLSSLSAVETNREYLIRKKRGTWNKQLKCMTI